MCYIISDVTQLISTEFGMGRVYSTIYGNMLLLDSNFYRIISTLHETESYFIGFIKTDSKGNLQ
jgi:hypothetical protein